jgi:hypothetical protein
VIALDLATRYYALGVAVVIRGVSLFHPQWFSGPFSEREVFPLVFCLGIYVMDPETCIFSDFLFIVISNQDIKYIVNIGRR